MVAYCCMAFDLTDKFPRVTYSRKPQLQRQQQRERQKSSGFIKQNNNFARASRFFVYSLPLLHDYGVKLPNFTFYGGRKQATTNECGPYKNSNPRKIADMWHFQRIGINTTKFEKTGIYFKSDIFVAVCRSWGDTVDGGEGDAYCGIQETVKRVFLSSPINEAQKFI